ncbi:MAG: hydrogenase iron-sulfur subunit [bacterium]
MMDTQNKKVHEDTTQKMAVWQPKIVAFLCNWCSYAGADLAGTNRLKYKSNIRIIKVPCSGKIDPLFILKSFCSGADGVLISGCHPGDCHYSTGNFYARRKFALIKYLLEFCGMDQRRIHFSWVSAAEGKKWSQVVEEVTESVRAAGPFNGFDSIEKMDLCRFKN